MYKRQVHRHACFAVANDSSSISQRGAQGVTECSHHVFNSVVVARLEVANTFQAKVHATVERQLLEHVVIKSVPRVNKDTTFTA